MSKYLAEPLELPCGAVIPNRLAKAAMTEGLADSSNRPTEAHARLYRQWAEGGVGLSITGNVMVDRAHLERPGNVAVVSRQVDLHLKEWARAGRAGHGQIWMQIGHAGRQTPKYVNPAPKGPSVSKVELAGQFGKAVAFDSAEIDALINRFSDAAWVAKAAGFTGVQIHAAHGFLISQFLSPVVNTRSDQWGGSLINRARLLMSIVEAVRAVVGSGYPVSVKLNSEDFQQGGFSFAECIQVVKWLDAAGVDLLEVTGGSYERPRMVGYENIKGRTPSDRTVRREAYFLDYAKRIRMATKMPVMVTGGFRTRIAMTEALRNGELDMIGLARPFIAAPDLATKLLEGRVETCPTVEKTLAETLRWFGPRSPISIIRLMNIQGQQGWFYHQLRCMGRGEHPDFSMGAMRGLFSYLINERRAAHQLKRPLNGVAEARQPTLTSCQDYTQ